jgi:hypothetical protein
MRESPRTRRLRSDLKALVQLQEESTIFDFKSFGDPPHTYVVRFRGRGLAKEHSKRPVSLRDKHEVRVELGASYPRLQPELAWQTPIFHPNISAGGVVCLGGFGTYWVPSLNLDELCEMLWDMVRYANFDVNSPYNRESAAWAKMQNEYRFPIDPRPIRDRLSDGNHDRLVPDVLPFSQGAKAAVAPVAPPVAAPLPFAAPPPFAATPPARQDIMFLDDEEIVDAEAVDDEPDILIIE